MEREEEVFMGTLAELLEVVGGERAGEIMRDVTSRMAVLRAQLPEQPEGEPLLDVTEVVAFDFASVGAQHAVTVETSGDHQRGVRMDVVSFMGDKETAMAERALHGPQSGPPWFTPEGAERAAVALLVGAFHARREQARMNAPRVATEVLD